MKKFITCMIILVLAVCMLTACEDNAADPANANAHTPVNVVCVIGAANNNPVVDPTDIQELTGLVDRPNSTYTVINAEGTPRVVCEGTIDDLSSTGYTKVMLDRIHASQAAGIQSAIANAAPITEEVDIAAATTLAVRSLRINESAEAENVLVYYLSGISTSGLINMSDMPVFKLDIEASVPLIIEQMDLDMSGINVVMYCCGDTAGEEQAALSSQERGILEQFYEKLFLGMGANDVNFVDALPSGGCYDFDQAVSVMETIKVGNGLQEKIIPAADKETVEEGLGTGMVLEFSDTDISFGPNSTEVSDPEKATKALSYVIEYMEEHEDFELLICGTTTSAGEKESCKNFSEKRAKAIRKHLVEVAGIDEDRIHILGCGYSSCLYQYDRTDDGALDEDIAPSNRSVKMVAYDSDTADEIRDSLKA